MITTDTHPITEVGLVREAITGNITAFETLVNRYEKRLLYYILRLTCNTEESLDILQDVWLTAFSRIRHLRSPEAFRVWIYQIAHDKAVSRVRKMVRGPKLQDPSETDEQMHPEATSDPENVELVHYALQQLTWEHREVLTLHFLEDMRVEEIAIVLTCPVGTIKSRLYYAKREMRQVVEKSING